jgi:hypothetical protein
VPESHNPRSIAADDTDHARVMAKVDTTGDCWFWTGSTSPAGYGRVRFRGAFWQAHRAVYTLLRGEIADGMELDLQTRACVDA